MEQIMNAYIGAFFDLSLKERDSPLLESTSTDYPVVSLESTAAATGLNSAPAPGFRERSRSVPHPA